MYSMFAYFQKNKWAIIFLVSYMLVGSLVNLSYPSYSGFVYLAFFLALVPAALTLAFAPRLAYAYLYLHWMYHEKFYKHLASTYRPDERFRAVPRLRKVATSTIVSIFGIMYIVVSLAGIDPKLLPSGNGYALIILSLLLALFVAPSLNIASWLLVKSGIMYESKVDGTRNNVGVGLRRFLDRVVGPIAAASFLKVLFLTYSGIGPALAFVVVSLILCVPSIIVTFLLLRKKALEKMPQQLDMRLRSFKPLYESN